MKKKHINIITFFVFILLSSVIITFITNPRESIVIRERKSPELSNYILWPHNCLIVLQLSKKDSKHFFITDMTGCYSVLGSTFSCSYEIRMRFTDRVLEKIAKDTENMKYIRSYYSECFGTEPMYRLASAAAASPEWDRKNGRPINRAKGTSTEDLVKKYLQKNNVFKELSNIFEKYHLKLKIEDVEEVHIAKIKSSQIADYAKYDNSTISPDDKLPISASVLFLLEPQ